MFAVFVLALSACSRRAPRASASPPDTTHPETIGTPVAFRLPRAGGIVAVYRLPSLEEVKWGAGRVSSPRSAVGVDRVGRRLVFRDSTGSVATYDLVASRERVVAPHGSLAALGSDGTLLAVDTTGSVIESEPWGVRVWTGSLGRGVRAVFAAPGGRLLLVRHSGTDSVAVATRENGVSGARRAPAAAARTASRDGDAVAFAVDSGVVVVEEGERARWFVRLVGKPSALAFSPSGHRIYIALAEKNALAVIDRFAQKERNEITLPGHATALRMDPWGRVLLVRGEAADSVAPTWVVSIADDDVAGTLGTAWASDLPTVTKEGVVLVRQGGAVVARDVRTLDSLGALAGGAGDLWFTGRGSPPPATASLRAAAADSGHGAAPAAARRMPAEPPATTYWVQVSVSRNEAWARALAQELNAGHHDAHVGPPADSTEGWRVLTGPYRSREAADSAGRALGRPYWVVDRGPRQ